METKLKAKDLMIGDWVKVNGKCIQVENVYKDMINYTPYIPYAQEEYFIEGKDITPIPLTAEVLKENNFEKHYDGDIIVYTHPQGIIIEMGINYKLFDDGRFYVRGIQHRLYYVHELQHALRLCGVDKEIVL